MSTDSTNGMFSKKNKSFSEREGTRNSTFFHFVRHSLVGIYHHWWKTLPAAEAHKELCVFSPLQRILLAVHFSDYFSRLQWICLHVLSR